MHCLNLKNKLWKIGLCGDYSFWGHILAFGSHPYFAYRAVIQGCELFVIRNEAFKRYQSEPKSPGNRFGDHLSTFTLIVFSLWPFQTWFVNLPSLGTTSCSIWSFMFHFTSIRVSKMCMSRQDKLFRINNNYNLLSNRRIAFRMSHTAEIRWSFGVYQCLIVCRKPVM